MARDAPGSSAATGSDLAVTPDVGSAGTALSEQRDEPFSKGSELTLGWGRMTPWR